MSWKRWFVVVMTVVGVSGICVLGTQAASNSKEDKADKTDKAGQLYTEGVKLAEAGDFTAALDRLERAQKERKNDPDILNMLGFTQRKLGRLDAAFASYAKALELRPNFPQAREYLGEAHLQAALEQLRLLSEAGAQGEIAELRDAIAKAAWRAGVGNAQAAGDSARRW